MKKLLMIVFLFMMVGCSNTTQQVATQSSCETCTTSYTVRKPVELVFRDTTYTTVYEPKTYTSVKYVRQPYNSCETEICR